MTPRRLFLLLPVLAAFGAAQAPPPAPAPAPAGGVILGLDGKPDPLPDAAFVETVKQQ